MLVLRVFGWFLALGSVGDFLGTLHHRHGELVSVPHSQHFSHAVVEALLAIVALTICHVAD